MKILIFAGTKNGRELAVTLADKGHDIVVSSLSAYGSSLIPEHDRIESIYGKLDSSELTRLIEELKPQVIIDSTHPYAAEISRNLIKVIKLTEIKLIRYERACVIPKDSGLHFSSMDRVLDYLKQCEGNVFFTTGVNELPLVAKALEGTRIFARVLEVERSRQLAESSGVDMSQIIFQNPPHTTAMNKTLIKTHNIKFLVTKDSGKEGNIAEKIEAVDITRIELLVIDRPVLDFETVCLSEEEVLAQI